MYKCPHCDKEISDPVYGRDLGRLKALNLEQELVEVNRKLKALGDDGCDWTLQHRKNQLEDELSKFIFI